MDCLLLMNLSRLIEFTITRDKYICILCYLSHAINMDMQKNVFDVNAPPFSGWRGSDVLVVPIFCLM